VPYCATPTHQCSDVMGAAQYGTETLEILKHLRQPSASGDITQFCHHGKAAKLHISLLLFNEDCNLQSINMTFLITWDTDVVLERWDTTDSKRVVRTATAGRILLCQPCVLLPHPETHQTDTQGPAVQPCVLDGTEH